MFNLEDLPKDILPIILSRVTGECVLSCKLVCTTWKTLLRDRKVKEGLLYFVTPFKDDRRRIDDRKAKEATFYYGDYDDFINDDHTVNPFKTLTKTIKHPAFREGDTNIPIGSCNGLVCLAISHYDITDPVQVWNPFTGEYVDLPRLDVVYSNETYTARVACGFGYLQKTNEYKVVRIFYPSYPCVGMIQIYTLGSCSGWRSIGETEHHLKTWSPGVLADDILYFMDNKNCNILALHLADEAFQVVSLPPSIQDAGYSDDYWYPKLIREQLCLVHTHVQVDIWFYKKHKERNSFTVGKDYNSWSWTLEYSMPLNIPGNTRSCVPFALTASKKILLWDNNRRLVSYTPETATFKTFVNNYMDYVTFQAIPHRNSRVSLKALGICPKMVGYNAKAIGHSFLVRQKLRR